jgi:hypothetical protein
VALIDAGEHRVADRSLNDTDSIEIGLLAIVTA